MTIQSRSMTPRRLITAFVLAWTFVGVLAAPSFASGPAFKIYVPPVTTVTAGEPVPLSLGIQNVGGAATSGTVTITDTVGPGLTTPSAPNAPFFEFSGRETFPGWEESCATVGLTVTCTFTGTMPPGTQLGVLLRATVAPAATGTLTNSVSVSGGGAPGVSAEQSMVVAPRGPFGFSELASELLNVDGSRAVQAASDPAQFTTSVHFKTFASQIPGFTGGQPFAPSDEHFRNVTVNLPEGLIGDPLAAPVCTGEQLGQEVPSGASIHNLCPLDSQVGIAHVFLGPGSVFAPLYNMVPPPGVATVLGFKIAGTIIQLEAYVRPVDHGISIVSRNTTTTLPVTTADITVWGVPADKSHDPYRGECYQGPSGWNGLSCPTAAPRRAFLRMPTSCPGKPLQYSATADSYENENPGGLVEGAFTSPALSGCDLVPFAPGISVTPTGTAANSPTGVAVKLSLQQNDNPEGLAEADLKKAVVTLPEGMALNPSSADGLQACTDAQLDLGTQNPATCPDASEVGTVTLHTPLLENPIDGKVFVRTQNSSDPASGEMFRIAMELRDDRHGIDIKVPGQVAANPLTGQLTSTFDNNPQLPFSDITLHFKSGARAPLTTPASCLTQTTTADLYSWAQPTIPVHRAMTFNLTEGPEGTPCVSREPFNPGFDAGVSSVQAGGFTPFLATFTRKDADQSMQRVSVKMPQGLLGSLVGLPLCPEAQANAGTCSSASEIGSVTAGAGDGPTPFYVTGGHVYMTGPYEGAPFGLSVVVPAKAGPFDLGLVVVRAKVEVDPHTTQLTVTTDPLPQIVGGVPVNLRLVNVTINRPNFTYNPTSCDPTTVSGTITGGQGTTAAVSNHFQVTNCGALSFKPRFKVSVSGKTSRANGASLDAKLAYPKNIGQANIARVKVALPKQLPSRLTTLQRACTAQTFETNPSACPAPSRIGTATATTPVLPVPLSGPVYFVSHGGEAFPDLVVVLQGYGVTVDLVGTTFISKAGITSTTFKTVPDVPVGTFELKLPQGPFSALAANGNLCKAKLAMPTAFVAQDGTAIHQATPIVVTGCGKAGRARKASGHHGHKQGKHNKKGKRK